MSYKLKVFGFISPLVGFSQLAAAQTAVITYSTAPAAAAPAPPEAVPVLGAAGLLVLSALLLVYGAFWLRKNPQSIKFAITIIATGLLASASSVGWLVGNAEAVIATTTYLTSENPSPVTIASYPAVLQNDLDVSIAVTEIEVTGCPLGNTTSGTCELSSEIPSGESCTIDDIVCDAGPAGTFASCVGIWCLQEGTLGQSTQCESISPDGLTCYNPEIKYGSVEGGIPSNHTGNRYDQWCQQLGFASDSGVTFGSRSVAPPNGRLFGCTSYDENTWHWCDWQDGDWLDESLDHHSSGGEEITSISCTALSQP